MTGLAVLGSTGSIGRQALEVVAALGDRFSVIGLAAGHADDRFATQLAEWPLARAWAPGDRRTGVASARWATGGLEELATADGVDLVSPRSMAARSVAPHHKGSARVRQSWWLAPW